MEAIKEHQGTVIYLLDKASAKERNALLAQVSTNPKARRLIDYHVRLLWLLTQISKGLNATTELMCASILDLKVSHFKPRPIPIMESKSLTEP